jgi:hypothetical protein
MHLLLIALVFEAVATMLVVALCIAARRGDEKTQRALSAEEAQARQIVSDGPPRTEYPAPAKHPAARWLVRLFRRSNRGQHSG